MASKRKRPQRRATAPARTSGGGKRRAPKAAARKTRALAPAPKARAPQGVRSAGGAASVDSRLSDLAEAQSIMLPELAVRLAALEHMLVEQKVCRREDLVRARAFVDMSRGGM